LRLEGEAAAFLQSASRQLARSGDEESARLADGLAAAARAAATELAHELGREPPETHYLAEQGDEADAAKILFSGTGVLERALDHYLDWAERSPDAETAAEIRARGQAALARLAALQARLRVIEGTLPQIERPAPARD
jgi:hypothetical protein